MVAPLSLDHTSLLNLCFPKETDDYRMIIKLANMMDEFVPHDEYIDDMDVMDINHVVNIVKLESVSLFDLFWVFAIVCLEDVQHIPTLELLENYVFGFCDDVSLCASYSPTSHVFDIDDESRHHDSNEDSLDFDLSSTYHKVSFASGDVEIVDLSTGDQPRELNIGSALSIDEIDRFI
ncbi:hypothetical protein AAG906_010663 [Vitis piasezkii]